MPPPTKPKVIAGKASPISNLVAIKLLQLKTRSLSQDKSQLQERQLPNGTNSPSLLLEKITGRKNPMDPRFEQFKDLDWKSMSFPEKRDVWLQISDMSAENFDAMMANQKARQSQVPKVGDNAPDFELERLDRTKKRTGDYVKLSDLRGKSVALCFGSYT